MITLPEKPSSPRSAILRALLVTFITSILWCSLFSAFVIWMEHIDEIRISHHVCPECYDTLQLFSCNILIAATGTTGKLVLSIFVFLLFAVLLRSGALSLSISGLQAFRLAVQKSWPLLHVWLYTVIALITGAALCALWTTYISLSDPPVTWQTLITFTIPAVIGLMYMTTGCFLYSFLHRMAVCFSAALLVLIISIATFYWMMAETKPLCGYSFIVISYPSTTTLQKINPAMKTA
jgi:hypothetical protein